MINVYPLKGLTTQYNFKDSKGSRCVLHPAADKEDIGKTAQEFNGEDPAVAAFLLERLALNEIKVKPKDGGILDTAVKLASVDNEAEEESIITDAVDKAVEDAGKDHEAAIATLKEEHEKAIGALNTDHEAAIDTLKTDHETALSTAADAAKVDQDAAVKTAVDASDEGSMKALEDLGKEHETAIAELNATHKEALKAKKTS